MTSASCLNPAEQRNLPASEAEFLSESLEAEHTRKTGNLRCPHCRSIGYVHTSRAVTDTHREVYYSCTNVACAHSWKASLSYEYGLSPSAIPDPKVELPMRPLSREDIAALRDQPGKPPMDDPNQLSLFSGNKPEDMPNV